MEGSEVIRSVPLSQKCYLTHVGMYVSDVLHNTERGSVLPFYAALRNPWDLLLLMLQFPW